MKIFLSLLTLILFIGSSSCNKDKDTISGCLQIKVDKNLFDAGPQDPTTSINDIIVDGDCLIMSLSYSGGCETHDIKLVTDGQESFSNPPSRLFKLIHNNTDPCEAYLTEEWNYDLNSLDYHDGFLELEIEGYSKKIIVELN